MATAQAGRGPEPDVDDRDSAYGDDSQSLMTSVVASIYEYRKEHGRTYHAYKEGNYPFPNDGTELDRLDLQHVLFANVQDDKLFLSPIDMSKANEVLDIGTGTGIWAIEFADKYPDSHVLGTDLSPCQPQWVPSNLEFQVDDANDDWTFKQKFDFIHVREMQMAVEEKKLFRQALQNLQPGGWFEIKGGTLPLQCDDDSYANTALEKWSSDMAAISRQMGRAFDNPYHWKEWMEEAGFINITEKPIAVPINTWPKDEKLKEVGRWQHVNLLNGLQGFTVKLFVQFLQKSEEEVEKFLEQVRKDLGDRKIHAYLRVFVVTGQKPPA